MNKTNEMGCAQILATMTNFYLEHRIVFPTSRSRNKGYLTEILRFALHFKCGSKVCKCIDSSVFTNISQLLTKVSTITRKI